MIMAIMRTVIIDDSSDYAYDDDYSDYGYSESNSNEQ